MKFTKKILAAAAAAVLLAGTLAGCSGKQDGYRVGICQLVQHPALDAATEGFQAALTEKLGDKVHFEVRNASGEQDQCTSIINSFVSGKVDLILANATMPLQIAASATTTIPILGTSVTDYTSALELPQPADVIGGNISGTSDLAPLDQQAEMIHELFPDAKTVGMLYCSSETNSKFQVDKITEYLSEYGITCKNYAFTDTNDVSSITRSACRESDVIYIPTDNTAASNTEAIANEVIPAGIPVVAGEEGICSGCGVASLSISYYDLGYTTGLMAAQILTGEKDIGQMPIAFASQASKKYNSEICQKLGIAVPEGYEPIG